MQFVCRLGTPDGRVIEETHEASNESSLRYELERRGLHLFEAKRRGMSLSLPALRRNRAVSTQDFLIFNQELASLLKAGLPLLQTLELMLERMEEGRFREVLTDIRDRVKSGEELSEAFGHYAELFPRLYPATLTAGERSGDLEGVIRRFVRYLQLITTARKRVVSALVYPAVLVVLSIGMIAILSLVVVPKFDEFFAGMNVELPLITKITLGVSGFAVDNLVWIVLAVIGATILFRRWGKTDSGRFAIDRTKLKVPLLGGILHRFALSELCRSLATLLAGGIPLVPSFEISVQAVGNAFVRNRLEPTIQEVREGRAFYEALESSGVMTNMAIDMVKVGEATGALDEMLTNVSDFLDDQVETRMARLLTMIEPLMLVFMGAVIGLLLSAIYLPLFGSMSQGAF